MFHVEMYAIADRIQNEDLKLFAQERFGEVARTAWDDPAFPWAIEAVYTVAPPGPKGEPFRCIATRVAAQHAKMLFEKDSTFDMITENNAGFGRDLAKALTVTYHQERDTFRCLKPSCGFSFGVSSHTSSLDTLEDLYCPVCCKRIGFSEIHT
jgi:hypothetical protein